MTNTTLADAAPRHPNMIGKYRLISELGQGGMATVYLALWRGPAGFKKLVVIKRMRRLDDPDLVRMFLDEAKVAARLSHANIVQTNEVASANGEYFIAMEYLEGLPLSRLLRFRNKGAPITLPMVLRVLCAALAGLHYAHDFKDFDGVPLSLVHRDASPHNIFVTYGGEVKVVDFGIAKTSLSVVETRAGVLKGKIKYMAPEQARSDDVDRRVDVFSVGCILWEALAGHRMWRGKNEVQVLGELVRNTEELPSPRDCGYSVPDALEAICKRALALNAEHRYASAAEMRADILAYLDESGDRTTTEELGALLGRELAGKRAELSKIIEERVRMADEEADEAGTALEGTFDVPELTNSLFGPASSRSQSYSGSGRRSVSLSIRGPLHSDSDGASSVSSMIETVKAEASGHSVVSESNGRWRRSGMAAAVAAVLVASVVLALLLGRDSGESVAAVESTASEDVEVVLNLRAFPDTARIFLDGELLAGNPFQGRVVRDEVSHEIRFEASGHVTIMRTVALERDIAIEVALTKSAAPAPERVYVSSIPRGAALYVDGVDSRLRTPATLMLASGSHVEARLKRFSPARKKVKTGVAKILLKLEPLRVARRGARPRHAAPVEAAPVEAKKPRTPTKAEVVW